MLTRLWLTALLILGGWAFYSPPVHASCEVQTGTVTYPNGKFIGGDLCDAEGNKKVTGLTAGGSITATTATTSTAVAPSYVEGSATSPLSTDLNGNLRVIDVTGGGGSVSATATESAPLYTEGLTTAPLSMTLTGALRIINAYLAGGEHVDPVEENGYGRVVGGIVRGTKGNVMTEVTTNTTTSAVTIPTGDKSFFGSVTGTDPVGQVQKLYGGVTSGFVPATEGVLLCTLTLATATTKVDQCPVIRSNNLFYKVVTSNTTGTGASGELTVQY